MAERVGFEPTLEFPLNTLSKRAPSATRPPLQRRETLLKLTHLTGGTRRVELYHARAIDTGKSEKGIAFAACSGYSCHSVGAGMDVDVDCGHDHGGAPERRGHWRSGHGQRHLLCAFAVWHRHSARTRYASVAGIRTRRL